jgi:hypothetical protein
MKSPANRRGFSSAIVFNNNLVYTASAAQSRVPQSRVLLAIHATTAVDDLTRDIRREVRG